MPTPDEHQALSRRRDELRQELAHVAELRQAAGYRRCGMRCIGSAAQWVSDKHPWTWCPPAD